MIFNKVPKVRLPEIVAAEIEEAIMSGLFAAGSQLPSEQQLAGQFGVSRNVVREAFKFLKERGLIEIYNGSGAYVCQPSGLPTSHALGRYIRLMGVHTSVGALYEARRTLEAANARLAATRATPEDFALLTAHLQQMQDHSGSIDRWSEADLAFHLDVARATHNPFFSVLLEPLVDQMRDVIAEGFRVPGAAERGLAAHRRLLGCLMARDPDGAEAAILDHLSDSEARVQRLMNLMNASADPADPADPTGPARPTRRTYP